MNTTPNGTVRGTVLGYSQHVTAPYCDSHPGETDCGCGEMDQCVVCRESIPEGNGVTVDGDRLCRCCNSDAIEASREETTAVGVRL